MKQVFSLLFVPFLALAESPATNDVPVDVTRIVHTANGKDYVRPPIEFRAGHVKPRAFDQKKITRKKRQFTVQLPSGAPIPTPTWYKGRLYVSGGFHSKEYFCFDAKTGDPVWAVDLDDDGPTSAVCEDDIVVFNTESCTIFALHAATGKQLWSKWLGDPLTSTPAVKDGFVYTSYPSALWRKQGEKAPVPPPGSPGLNQAPGPQSFNPYQGGLQGNVQLAAVPVGKGLEHVGRMTHVIACLELKTGKIVWQRWIDSDVMSAPVVMPDGVHFTSFAGIVYHLRAKDGHVVKAEKMRATAAPLLVNDQIVVPQRWDDGKVAAERLNFRQRKGSAAQIFANPKQAEYLNQAVQTSSSYNAKNSQLDANNGFAGGAPQIANPGAAFGNIGQATVSGMQAHQGSRVLNAYGANYACMGDELVCNDSATGDKKWSVKLKGDLKKAGGFLASPPANAGKYLFIATLEGKVLQVEPKAGKIVKKHEAGHPLRWQPAVHDGRIFVGTQTGQLVAFDTGDKSLQGWTTWGGNPAHTGVNP